MQKTDNAALQAEQDTFDRELDEMLIQHAGEFVVFKERRAAGFYPTYRDAYAAALAKYGAGAVFLVSEVRDRGEESVSISWTAGVMAGGA